MELDKKIGNLLDNMAETMYYAKGASFRREWAKCWYRGTFTKFS